MNRPNLLQVAEADADEVADPAEFKRALATVNDYMHPVNARDSRRQYGRLKAQRWDWNAAYAVFLALDPTWQANEWRSAVCVAGLQTWPHDDPMAASEPGARVALVRCIFENPFDPASRRIDPQRYGPLVTALARGIYDERRFDSLPILGDALEEYGCDDVKVLDHCRSGMVHVRGSWVLDLLLQHGVGYYSEEFAEQRRRSLT